MTAAFIIPAFDPDSADSVILEAQDKVRRQRAWVYSFDGKTDVPEDDIAASDDAIIGIERDIEDNFATTIPGIIARLQTLLTVECDRWLDRNMSEGGFLAVYRRIGELDGSDQQLVHAINELYHLDWEQALAAYRIAEADLAQAGEVVNATDSARSAATKLNQRTGDVFDVDAAAVAAQNHFVGRSTRAALKLQRTLTPDHDAYLLKVEIMAAEGFDDALPWLARDTSFLIGRLYAAAPEGAR